MQRTIVVSGGFDPLHVGHLRMMRAASVYGDLIVAINTDVWLMRKKGFIFMPFEERQEIISGLGCVSATVKALDDYGSVCETLKAYKPIYFGNGGDRKGVNTPEVDLCKELGIQLVWNLGGDKVQSSSDLTSKVR